MIPVYIEALADSVKAHLKTIDFKPEVIVASFHGLPKDYLMKGDPYHCQCHKTARLLRERLGMSEKELIITFQSRFGPCRMAEALYRRDGREAWPRRA